MILGLILFHVLVVVGLFGAGYMVAEAKAKKAADKAHKKSIAHVRRAYDEGCQSGRRNERRRIKDQIQEFADDFLFDEDDE